MLIAGMEDMRSILMHIDAMHIFCVDIATYMVALVYQQHGASFFFQEVGAYGPKKSCAYYEIIIFLFHVNLLYRHITSIC